MLVEFEKLGLERKLDRKSFIYNEQEITVLQYLPIDEKEDLIAATLFKAESDGIYDPLLLDMYFHFNIIRCYTNISFVPQEDFDEADVYDILCTNGIIDKVLDNMDEDEYNYLFDMLMSTKEEVCKYKNSVIGLIRNAIDNLPQNAEKAVGLLKELDPKQFKELFDIANTLNTIPGITNN